MSRLGDRIMKVDHAGEHGAIAIYSGQIMMARFACRDLIAELAEFRSHEQRHRAIFQAELRRRGARRCRSYWLCGVGGFVLGTVTGLLGRAAIGATTVAVERVVLRHLNHQVEMLGSCDPEAVRAIESIMAEEQKHHDESTRHANAGTWWPRILTPIVGISTESAIWLGMKL